MGVVVTVVVVGVLMRVLVAVDMLVLVMMLVLVVFVVVVMVVMSVLVRVLGSSFIAIEPGHVVVVILKFAGELNIEVTSIDAVLAHARHGNLKAVDRERGELLAQVLLAGAQIE